MLVVDATLQRGFGSFNMLFNSTSHDGIVNQDRFLPTLRSFYHLDVRLGHLESLVTVGPHPHSI